MKKNNIINIILILFLVGCLFKMPYSYYQLTRVILTIGFSSLIFISIKYGRFIDMPFLLIGLIVFNPVVKFSFTRNQWHIIDMVTICVLLAYTLFNLSRTKQSTSQ